MGHKQYQRSINYSMHIVTDPVPGDIGQDAKLIALQIFKLTFFGQLTYLILKVL